MKKLIAAIVLIVLAAAVLWRNFQPPQYRLAIANQSELTVDQVRLFGSGVTTEQVTQALEPGSQRVISVSLKAEGSLRFEVIQGGNRIDTYIEEDVADLSGDQQRLIIHPHNRFIINTVAQ